MSSTTRVPTPRRMYRRLARAFGPQHWWPAKSPFEVMVGAILTQATQWGNVERAIARLKAAGALSARALAKAPPSRVQRLIRPSGYFRQKARRLQAFCRWFLQTFNANPGRMFRTDPWTLRRQLLAVPGIGPETADSILLYAGQRPVFVIDAYTRRIFRRHGLIAGEEPYDELQGVVMSRLPKDPKLFNEFHALLVQLGKRYCHRRHPDCPSCPLGDWPRQLEEQAHG